MVRILGYTTIGVIVSIAGLWLYLDRERGDPVDTFDYFHSVFDERYALFDIKGVDWAGVRDLYFERIDENTTDDELFAILQEILLKLDDRHCYIHRFNQVYFSGFGLPALNYLELLSFDFRFKTEDFSLDLVRSKYLDNSFDRSLRIYSHLPPVGVRSVFTSGWLADSIAYLHMTEMSNRSNAVHHSIIEFYHKYKDAKGFVIDIRDNIGGYALPAKKLAEIFLRSESVYAVSRVRSRGANAYEEPDYWKIEPSPERRINDKPVAVLVNRNTQSAAELFALMMKQVPNVRLFGSTTSGIFGDTYTGRLPNGWEYRLSIRKTNDANDIPLEGIGITPDQIIDNAEFVRANTDMVLESGMEYIVAFDAGW